MTSDAGEGISVTETHVSTLFFTGERVYKVKKAVDNGFLDFTTSEARLAACRREVELNRRLAPDVYLGVADLTMDGQPLDHFVVMRRLPPHRRLAALLDSEEILAQLERLAELVAEFHARADRGAAIDDACTPEALAELWRSGVEQLTPFVGEVLDAESVHRMTTLAERELERHSTVITERLAAGRACDGHGDLLAEDVFCMDDGPRVLDCLEFDDRLRYGDVLADVAFLAMDLERLGHPELGAAFLEHYRNVSGDSWPPGLAHLHIAYRAHVRSKVTCLRHAQGDASAGPNARALHHLAVSHLERARPLLVLVGGAPGTGKTTVATAVSGATGAVRLSSDELRGEVVAASTGPAGVLHEGRYAPARVDEVYAELVRRARPLLDAGGRVVLDASWARRGHRSEARDLASSTGARLVELCCTCPPEVAAVRVARRTRAGGDASEVTPELARQLASARDPWPEAATIDTMGPPDEVAGAAVGAVRPDPAIRA